MRLIWTAPAIGDLAAARTYIAFDNLSAADDQILRVLGAVASQLQPPESGRPGRIVGTRELVVAGTPFVVPYRVDQGAVQILRVLHGRQRRPESV
jgi:toxin ParE1/3/4